MASSSTVTSVAVPTAALMLKNDSSLPPPRAQQFGAGATGAGPAAAASFAEALTVSLYSLAALTALTAGLVQLLPRAAAR